MTLPAAVTNSPRLQRTTRGKCSWWTGAGGCRGRLSMNLFAVYRNYDCMRDAFASIRSQGGARTLKDFETSARCRDAAHASPCDSGGARCANWDDPFERHAHTVFALAVPVGVSGRKIF